MHFKLFKMLIVAVLMATVCLPLLALHAQSDPLPIVDAAYKDLSSRLGKSILRGGDSTYSWAQDVYADASLGCPQPGQTYAQVVSSGYKITINYQGIAYDYRAKLDGSGLFLCSPNGTTGNITPVPATAAAGSSAQFGPYNLFLNYSLAFIAADGNVAVRNPGPQGTTNGALLTTDSVLQTFAPFNWPSKFYTNLRASPDGKKLAWVGSVDNTNAAFVSVAGGAPQQAAAGMESGISIAWSPDGSKLAFAVPTKQFKDQAQVYQIQAVPVDSDGVGVPEYAGTIDFGVGCGGGSPDPSDSHYSLDAGFGGQGIIFEWTDKGFIHSLNCTGVGLALTAPNGQQLWKAESVSRPKLSPDHSRIVGIQESETFGPFLVVVDAVTGKVTSLRDPNAPTSPIVHLPQQVAWSFDGKQILYATEDRTIAVQGSEGNSVGLKLFGNWPFEAVKRDIIFWKTDPTPGATPVKMLEQPGRGIGTISAAPDNTSVAVSFFTDTSEMVTRINNGATVEQAMQAAPTDSIIRVWLDGGSPPELFGTGRSPVFISGQFVANPVPLTQHSMTVVVSPNSNSAQPASNASAPNLTVGGKAVVTTAEDNPLNLRQTPSVSAPVKRILKKGAVVDVLSGPQSAEGFRWWQVRADDGSVGYVVDQVTDETGTLINTLSPQ